MIIFLWTFIFSALNAASAANWAQASGQVEQNTVFPYIPSPANKHWQSRYGMVIITIPGVIQADGTNVPGKVYLIGGDTYDGDPQQTSLQTFGLMDQVWSNGYKNDVWIMYGTKWMVKGDPRLRTQYHNKLVKTQSMLRWDLLTPGLMPLPGQTYEEYLVCQPYFVNVVKYRALQAKNCPNLQTGGSGGRSSTATPVMFSPRRHHAGLYFNGYLWVMGGRAREFVPLPEIRSVGGILYPRVEEIPLRNTTEDQKFTTQREAIVYKSDVWKSKDGITWELVTPGCRAPQKVLVADGNHHEGKYGSKAYACSSNDDCYGAESCDATLKTCVCQMWSPREQHAVASHGGYMYLSGGYTSKLYSEWSDCGPYACGDTDASAYRHYLSDVWKSSDGETWVPVTQTAFNGLGRGGHQMLVIPDKKNTKYYLWVIGGRGGDNSGRSPKLIYYKDVWSSSIEADNPYTWFPRYGLGGANMGDTTNGGTLAQSYWGNSSAPWAPRTGHVAVFEDATADNLYTRSIHIMGGYGPAIEGNSSSGEAFFDDSWSWRIDVEGDDWREDFTPEEVYGTGVGSAFHYNTSGPSPTYVSPDSELKLLQRYFVPYKMKFVKPLKLRNYLSDHNIKLMNSIGIYTIRDLATADKYKILKLRGFDYPQVPLSERMDFTDVCDFRALAIAVVDKCTVNLQSRLFDTQRNMPWNNIPAFGGSAPGNQPITWHGLPNYDMLKPGTIDVEQLIDQWDGCTYNPLIQGLHGPNVNGLGYVKQVMNIRDPLPELQELTCKQTPGPRAHHGATYFEGRFYIFGGKTNNTKLNADTWYRDNVLPTTSFALAPSDKSSNAIFELACSEPGCSFEYRVWNPVMYEELRPWTHVTHKADVSFLNWRVGGPGNGLYRIYVRAVDPAGNKDLLYKLGGNVYEWNYVSPAPLDIIFGVIGAFFGSLLLAYLEHKRRERKKAMERYAMKRMRRKFKALQQDEGVGIDWRVLYAESKEAGMLEGKRKTKKKKGGKEKKDKERMKRDKEKEKIKKKIRAAASKGGSMAKSAAGGNIFLKEKKKPSAIAEASKGSKGTRSLGVGAGARRSTKVYASGNDPDAGKKQSKVNPPGEDVQKKLKDYERLGMAGELDRERDRDRDKGRSGASLEQRRTGAPSEKEKEKEKRFKDYELKGKEPKKDK